MSGKARRKGFVKGFGMEKSVSEEIEIGQWEKR